MSVIIGEWNTATDIDCDPDEIKTCAPPVVRNKIVEKIIHEKYRDSSRNQHFDIALLRLEDKIEFNEYVDPICLPIDSNQLTQIYTGQTFDVAG